jgi:microcystin-dependent protein
VPNLVDRFALGIKADGVRNKEDGKATVALEVNHLPAHTHTTSGDSTDGFHRHNLTEECTIQGGFTYLPNIPANGTYANYKVLSHGSYPGLIMDRYTGSTNSSTHTHKIKETGGNVAHENMPPYCTVYYVIKIAN